MSRKSRTRAGEEGDCNPCLNQPPGALVCDGQNPAVHPAPLTGGPWALVWRNEPTQGWDWFNLGGAKTPAPEGTPEPAPEPAPEPQPPEGGE